MRRIGLAILVAVTLAACGSGRGGTSAPAERHLATQPNPLQLARAVGHNQALAAAEAARLLALAPVPAGATRIVPTAVQRRAIPDSIPGVRSLVDRSSYRHVDLSAAASLAWLKAHPVRGLTRDGVMTSSGPTEGTGYGVTWSAPASLAWASSELQIGLIRAPAGGSLWRIEAQVVWLDPRPVPDVTAGDRFRVTVAGGCPASDAHRVGVTNPGADLAHVLVPATAPTAALVCRYAGLNGSPPMGLQSSTRLAARQAEQVVAGVRQLSLAHTVGAEVSCPADDGSVAIVVLAYPNGPDVDLWGTTTGCNTVSNGTIEADGTIIARH